MDWLEDDEMMRPWEGVSKQEEKITVRNEGSNKKSRRGATCA